MFGYYSQGNGQCWTQGCLPFRCNLAEVHPLVVEVLDVSLVEFAKLRSLVVKVLEAAEVGLVESAGG